MARWYYDIRCSICGRFCKPADDGVMHGSSYDWDPPDPEYFCKNCFNDLIAKAKDQPEKIPISCWWIKPQYVSVAKAIMRHRRKHH